MILNYSPVIDSLFAMFLTPSPLCLTSPLTIPCVNTDTMPIVIQECPNKLIFWIIYSESDPKPTRFPLLVYLSYIGVFTPYADRSAA